MKIQELFEANPVIPGEERERPKFFDNPRVTDRTKHDTKRDVLVGAKGLFSGELEELINKGDWREIDAYIVATLIAANMFDELFVKPSEGGKVGATRAIGALGSGPAVKNTINAYLQNKSLKDLPLTMHRKDPKRPFSEKVPGKFAREYWLSGDEHSDNPNILRLWAHLNQENITINELKHVLMTAPKNQIIDLLNDKLKMSKLIVKHEQKDQDLQQRRLSALQQLQKDKQRQATPAKQPVVEPEVARKPEEVK